MKKLGKTSKKLKKRQAGAYEIAIKTMAQNYEREKRMVRILFVIILALLAINAYFAYQFTTTSVMTTEETTTEQNGAYNFYDSEGNMISSDLSLDEMQELIDLNGGAE